VIFTWLPNYSKGKWQDLLNLYFIVTYFKTVILRTARNCGEQTACKQISFCVHIKGFAGTLKVLALLMLR